LLLRLDFSSEIPIYHQIRDQIVMGIASGHLTPGQKLPTVRVLAEEIGVNAMTVSKAYQLLKQEGHIETDRRSGAVVCAMDRGTVSADTLRGLRLRLCELRLSGMGREEALKLCEQLFDEEVE